MNLSGSELVVRKSKWQIEGERVSGCVSVYESERVFVSVNERERERERECVCVCAKKKE